MAEASLLVSKEFNYTEFHQCSGEDILNALLLRKIVILIHVKI